MQISPSKLNSFLMFKLPSAYVCGVRVKEISNNTCMTSVKYKWINQNPFNSMFWAVQGMAAELSTGALMMMKIKESGKKISMLVANNNATFTKKATGRITFSCNEGHLIDEAIAKAVETGEGQTLWMQSVGVNSEGAEVSTFNFEWTIKVKS
ncbi:MAG: DUF4442 domain-containing protein [Mangrovimonas sp.]|nr:DUF4442 domain-containing protein [Mangrovimonas sp.]MCB0432357.1 DUF4442 domain-containing protein [Mangrovimonas sp.]MCB0439286.1 DUF4442 domain-containing protein [Mangrovimonas sp.]HPF98272.1 DUF4442 domain-containing protein [Mangrovimonas sp.]HRV54287.1 DUF4442 domain-containing protein [Mangrovimonas sp.]